MAKIKNKTTAIPARTQRDINARKYRSRAEREAQANRIVLLVAGGLFAIVVVILMGSFLIEGLIVPNQPVLAVGNQAVSTRDFQRRVTFERWRTGSLLAQVVNQFGPQNADQILGSQQSPYGQLYAQLSSPTQMGLRVLNDMQAELLVKQYADANGVKVSDEEMNKKVNEFFGYDPNPQTPTATTTPSLTPTPLVSATPTSSPTPTVAPTITATFTSTPFPTGIPTATPGATEQKKLFDENAKAYYQRAATATGMTESEIRQIFYMNALQDKVKETLFGKPKDEEEQVKVRHILVATEDQAKDAMTALQNGESFANLAKAVSTDTGSGAQGGDLGWAQKGAYVAEFEDAVWSDKTKPGDVLGPIKSQFGYHIIQLEGRESRVLTEEQKTQALDKKFQDWITAQATEKKATKFDYWTERVPNTPTLDQLGLPSLAAQ